MKYSKLLLIATICTFVSACNMQDWMDNSQVWNTQSQSYQYTLKTVPATVETEIHVTDGLVSSAFVVIGENKVALPAEALLPVPSIQTHFLFMLPLMTNSTLDVSYDETYGYPTSYTAIQGTATVATGVEISNLIFTD